VTLPGTTVAHHLIDPVLNVSEEPNLPEIRLFLLVLFEVVRWLTGH
jgi:hypothetical protein